jgi:hypothetical protein
MAMNVLSEFEFELVSGGKADFSGVTARVDSTEKILSECDVSPVCSFLYSVVKGK